VKFSNYQKWFLYGILLGSTPWAFAAADDALTAVLRGEHFSSEEIEESRKQLKLLINQGNFKLEDVEIKDDQLRDYHELLERENEYKFTISQKDRLDEFYAYLMSQNSIYDKEFLRQDDECFIGMIGLIREIYDPIIKNFLETYSKIDSPQEKKKLRKANPLDHTKDSFLLKFKLLTGELSKISSKEKNLITAFYDRLKIRFKYIEKENVRLDHSLEYYFVSVLLLRGIGPTISLTSNKQLNTPDFKNPIFFFQVLLKLGFSPELGDFKGESCSQKDETVTRLLAHGDFVQKYNQIMNFWINPLMDGMIYLEDSKLFFIPKLSLESIDLDMEMTSSPNVVFLEKSPSSFKRSPRSKKNLGPSPDSKMMHTGKLQKHPSTEKTEPTDTRRNLKLNLSEERCASPLAPELRDRKKPREKSPKILKKRREEPKSPLNSGPGSAEKRKSRLRVQLEHLPELLSPRRTPSLAPRGEPLRKDRYGEHGKPGELEES
jgi:hypothetical protein